MAEQWPVKRRDIFNHHMDSTIWNDFEFREGDIVVATYGKSGTTWMQQIVLQLVFDGQEGLDVMGIAPWLEMRILPRQETLQKLAQQTHRRSVKTHLPADALVISPTAKYIYVARDGRDVCWSLYNHHCNMGPDIIAQLNDTPCRVGPPFEPPGDSIVPYFRSWLDGNGTPFWSFWESVRSWWSVRHLPNVLLVHYADLKADLSGEMRRVARFLDIGVDAQRWQTLVEHCSFEYMKRHGPETLPLVEQAFVGGANAFIHKGVNGRWRDALTTADCAHYETIAREQLGKECAEWLSHDRLARPDGPERNAAFASS
jgi:aryl sulfotransferase